MDLIVENSIGKDLKPEKICKYGFESVVLMNFMNLVLDEENSTKKLTRATANKALTIFSPSPTHLLVRLLAEMEKNVDLL